jgi:hypothetical protein
VLPTVLGLVLAALAVVFGYLQWRHPKAPKSSTVPNQPQPPLPEAPTGLLVTVATAFLLLERVTDPQIQVTAVNATSRAFQVDGMCLQIESTKEQIIYLHLMTIPKMPCTLRETEKVQGWFDRREVGKMLVSRGMTGPLRLRGTVTDTYGGTHCSDWFDFKPQEAADYHL